MRESAKTDERLLSESLPALTPPTYFLFNRKETDRLLEQKTNKKKKSVESLRLTETLSLREPGKADGLDVKVVTAVAIAVVF